MKNHLQFFSIFLFIFMCLLNTGAQAASSYNVPNGASNYNINEWGQNKNVTNSCGANLFVPTNTSGEWTSFINNHPGCATVATASTDCNVAPWGFIPNGGQVDGFHSNTVSCGFYESYGCAGSNHQVRTCTNGVLSGSAAYSGCSISPACYCGDSVCSSGEDCNNCSGDCGACPSYCGDATCDCPNESALSCPSDCNVGSCPNCTMPDSTVIYHGFGGPAYPTPTVPCGDICDGPGYSYGETRVCYMGSLSGSYGYSTCSVEACGPCCGGQCDSNADCGGGQQCCENASPASYCTYDLCP